MDVTVNGTAGANGANGVGYGAAGADGSAGAAATATNTTSSDPTNTAHATGGSGGAGGNGAAAAKPGGIYNGNGGAAGAGAAGGYAYASASTSAASASLATAGAYATGGVGGADGIAGLQAYGKHGASMNPGAAGGASALATVHNSGAGGSSAKAVAVGGAGGYGDSITYYMSTRGTVTSADGATAGAVAKAYSSAVGAPAYALASQTGGQGGAGKSNVGGAGAPSDMVSAVGGYTNGGNLTLKQVATGGAGPTAIHYTAGAAGAASCKLTFDDPANPTQSADVLARSYSYGGAGGGGSKLGSPSNGGAAYASSNVTGVQNVGSYAKSVGGAGGAGGLLFVIHIDENNGGAGGRATAGARGVSTGAGKVTASATAISGAAGYYGYNANYGAKGAVATLINAVSGQSNGGSLYLDENAYGGAGGASGLGGQGGKAKSTLDFDDTKNATQSALVSASINATGGAGGGLSVENGGVGGHAAALCYLTAAHTVIGTSRAIGGADGSGRYGTGAGPAARAISVVSGAAASASALATGGAGAAATVAHPPGTSADGGTGGYAAASASATGVTSAQAYALQTGGAGGGGGAISNAGRGAASDLVNAVTGSTHGGSLTLTQNAVGGAGGGTTLSNGAGGVGGAATSNLVFDDARSAFQSASVTGTVSATGGAGGAGTPRYAGSCYGGIAQSYIALSGAGTAAVNASATATGGASGPGTTVVFAAGTATARTVAVGGGAVTAAATAHGGQGTQSVGATEALTRATGVSGSLDAHADTSLAVGHLIQSVAADASGPVDGTSKAKAKVEIDGGLLSFHANGQMVAVEAGAPDASTVLAANAAIAAALSASPTIFSVGALGGGHSNTGSSSQTTTSTIDLTADLTQLATRGDLVIGLFSPTVLGTGVTGVTFDLKADGVDEIDMSFSSVAAAQTFFTDNPIDLGSLASGPLSGNTLTIQATLTVTTDSTGSAFYGQVLIADPPSAATHASRFAQAMAGMGGSGVDSAAPLGAGVLPTQPMLAMSRMAAVA